MILKQVQKDLADNVIVSRATLVAAIDHAVSLQAALEGIRFITDDRMMRKLANEALGDGS